MGGKNFFKMSDACMKVEDFFINGETFDAIYNNGINIEQISLLLHYIIDNSPFAFKEKPLLYEQMRQFIAMKIAVDPNDIKLIGSAKTGFSISTDEFGRAYNTDSDFDFAIINKEIFDNLCNEYSRWKQEYMQGHISPKNERERGHWNANIEVVKNNIKRHFIDVGKLPALKNVCPVAQNILNTMWQVKENLEKYNKIYIRKASARIYSDFSSFYGQTALNISYVMEKRR